MRSSQNRINNSIITVLISAILMMGKSTHPKYVVCDATSNLEFCIHFNPVA